MALQIRRIVTGHDARGRSIFIIDDTPKMPSGRSSAGTSAVDLWETSATPADNSGNADPTDHPFRLPPPQQGSVLRVVEYPPDKERFAALRAKDWSADAERQGYTVFATP